MHKYIKWLTLFCTLFPALAEPESPYDYDKLAVRPKRSLVISDVSRTRRMYNCKESETGGGYWDNEDNNLAVQDTCYSSYIMKTIKNA